MPLSISDSAKNVLISSISQDSWASLDYQLFETLTGQSRQRASIIVRMIIGAPDDCDSKIVEYGRTYIHDAPDYGCRLARCFWRPRGSSGARFCWRRFDITATDDQIMASAISTLTDIAHLYRPGAREAEPVQQTLLSPPPVAAPQAVPVAATKAHEAMSDADLRSAIDRARAHLHELEMTAALRISEHERTIEMLRGR